MAPVSFFPGVFSCFVETERIMFPVWIYLLFNATDKISMDIDTANLGNTFFHFLLLQKIPWKNEISNQFQILYLIITGHVKKLDTLFFLNISKNNYIRAPKPFVMCFYLPV